MEIKFHQVRSCLLFVMIAFASSVSAQVVAGNHSFVLISSKTPSTFSEVNTSYYRVEVAKGQKKIRVRFKIKSVSGKKEVFDPNKLYLVSDKNKVRIRPIDVKHNFGIGKDFIGFRRYVSQRPETPEFAEYADYDPRVPDSFQDYKIEGYEDIWPSLNFAKKRGEPIVLKTYLGNKNLRNCKLDVYFSLPQSLFRGNIYYGDTLITQIY